MKIRFRHFTSLFAAALLMPATSCYANSADEAKNPGIANAEAVASAPSNPVDDKKGRIAKTEQMIRDMMDLDKAGKIIYQDERGKVMGEEVFFESVSDGQAFSAEKVTGAGGNTVETLKLQTKEQQAQNNKAATYKIKPGEKFPAFRLDQLSGGKLDSKQLAGHYALVNFYFAQCAPCRKEIPDLNALAAARKDMKFVALTFDSKSEARQFVSDTNFEWPIAADANNFIGKIGVKAYPAFALLDPHGVVIAMATHSEISRMDGQVGDWVNRLNPVAPVQ
ncbi:MAG TPA: TlpA disulfide reductase family protein [Burkholderiaceae bacterium]